MWWNVECMVRWLMISPESFKVCLDLTRHDARASQPNGATEQPSFSFARHPPFAAVGPSLMLMHRPGPPLLS